MRFVKSNDVLAGARKFDVKNISRGELFSGNRETAKETGIAHMCDANDESAKKILNSWENEGLGFQALIFVLQNDR